MHILKVNNHIRGPSIEKVLGSLWPQFLLIMVFPSNYFLQIVPLLFYFLFLEREREPSI